MESPPSLTQLSRLRASANSLLSNHEPLVLVAAPILTILLARWIQSAVGVFSERGFVATVIGVLTSLAQLIPGVKRYIDSEKQKVVDQMQASGKSKKDWVTELPRAGLGVGTIAKLNSEKQKDAVWQGRCSGTVYIGGTEREGHFSLINEACSMFSHTNPLHLDVFPSVARFEAEVVAMTAALLGSMEKTSGGQVCGNMTSGGTESILLAVKSSRD